MKKPRRILQRSHFIKSEYFMKKKVLVFIRSSHSETRVIDTSSIQKMNKRQPLKFAFFHFPKWFWPIGRWLLASFAATQRESSVATQTRQAPPKSQSLYQSQFKKFKKFDRKTFFPSWLLAEFKISRKKKFCSTTSQHKKVDPLFHSQILKNVSSVPKLTV